MDKPENLTIKQIKFVDGIFDGRTYTDAYLDAGYKATKRSTASAMASKLVRNAKVAAEIERRMELIERFNRVRLARISEGAISQLNRLVIGATDKDGVKLSAVKDALDRVGLKPPENTDVSGTMHFIIEYVTRDDT